MPRMKNTRKAAQTRKASVAAKLTPRQKRIAQRSHPKPTSLPEFEMAMMAAEPFRSDQLQ